MNTIHLKGHGLSIQTVGFDVLNKMEIRAQVAEINLLPYAEDLLRYIVDYVATSGRQVASQETFPYGYWVIRFCSHRDVLDLWEFDTEGGNFIPGVSQTLRYWRDQRSTCESARTIFSPPLADCITIIDDGVYEGRPIEGVRYPPARDGLSGWWITSDKYEGIISSLRREHTYHITARRPEVARYLALPTGFRFDLYGSDPVIKFDELAAKGDPK